MSSVAGGNAGDKGVGEASTPGSSTALPFPLSIFGRAFSSPSSPDVTDAAFSSNTVDVVLAVSKSFGLRLVAFFCNSLKRWAMRSETLAVR